MNRPNLASLGRHIPAFFIPGGRFDAVVTAFPPGLARRLEHSKIAKTTFMIAAHRGDLHIRRPRERKLFWQWALKSIESGRLFIAAASEFDLRYLNSLMSGQSNLWPLDPLHIRSVARLEPLNLQALFLNDTILSLQEKDLIFQNNCVPDMASQALPTVWSYNDLRAWPAFVYVPYSAYSIKLLELLATGRPVLVPSREFLMSLGVLKDVRLWPLYGSKKQILKFDVEFPRSLNLDSEEIFFDWLNSSQWRGAAIEFSSWADLDEKLENLAADNYTFSPAVPESSGAGTAGKMIMETITSITETET